MDAVEEDEASECRHEERCSEVQGKSDDEGEVHCDDEEEEARAAKPARDPGAPTTAEIAKHAVSHWPYRSSCPHCVKGRGRSRQHRTNKSSERTTPILSADYCFIGGGITDHGSPVLIMVDTETGMVFADVCKRKGADPMMKNIEVLGHRQIVFKSDSQAQREFAARQPEMMLKNSPKYHSAASGMVENAVQRLIGSTRVLQDALEGNIKQTIEPNTPVMTFMACHAATINNRVSVDQDGRTPMEKARGTTANRETAEFGEKILFQPTTKYNKGNKLDVRWPYGLLFMGVATKTNEIMMGGRDGQE